MIAAERVHQHGSDRTRSGLWPSSRGGLLGLCFGLAAGGGMYAWQRSTEIAVATALIAGYTAGLWFHLSASIALLNEHYRLLKTMSINRPARRAARLTRDFGFWWSLLFGMTVMASGAWIGGLRDWRLIAWIDLCWALTTVILNYEVTVLQPTTRCRACGYQLLGLLDAGDPLQVVRCPECGTKWSKSDLCLTPPATTSARSPTAGSTPAYADDDFARAA